MRTINLLILALCLIFTAARGHALPISVVESGSALILPNDPLYSSNYNGGTIAAFASGNPAAGYPIYGMILWKFNLASYTNQMFNGDVTITCGQNWGEAGPLPFRLYTVVSNWDETAVTWQNFLGPNTTNNNPPYGSFPGNNQAFTNALGVQLALVQCIGTSNPANPSGTNNWTFPGSLIQSWLSNPASNKGVALVPDMWGNMMWCTRSRVWDLTRAPTLMAEVIPEPATLALIGAGLLLALRRR